MNTEQIRKAYLDFYAERGHEIIPRAPLVLSGDPTTLFTGSGMQPMIPYLLGEPHPKGVRIADSQTCLRAQDIDDIGDANAFRVWLTEQVWNHRLHARAGKKCCRVATQYQRRTWNNLVSTLSIKI
jgi:hypothetical protein